MSKHVHIHLHRGRTLDFARGRSVVGQDMGTLYAGHPVAAASVEALEAWARSHGFVLKHEPHVTTVASRTPISLKAVPKLAGGMIVPAGGRRLDQFGDHVVLCLACPELERRHEEYKRIGASWDFPKYQPHISVGRASSMPPLAGIVPFDEPITLGPEELASFDDY